MSAFECVLTSSRVAFNNPDKLPRPGSWSLLPRGQADRMQRPCFDRIFLRGGYSGICYLPFLLVDKKVDADLWLFHHGLEGFIIVRKALTHDKVCALFASMCSKGLLVIGRPINGSRDMRKVYPPDKPVRALRIKQDLRTLMEKKGISRLVRLRVVSSRDLRVLSDLCTVFCPKGGAGAKNQRFRMYGKTPPGFQFTRAIMKRSSEA
ncbi:unnamed protein product [Effrenium voratum]|uniref:Uncharacterized protein n=1 Tax=Effrenium voratum TaxID=2562239 RepID=A0AA36ISA7_9DINO|nr:unnamed protein product [Effrenium voratum]CAJ1393212.1 unnamed protein product [Effrenium voratum]